MPDNLRRGCRPEALRPVRSRRTRRTISSSDDIEPQFVPAVALIVLDANVVVTAAEGSEVERGLVWLPVVDHECAVDPDADAVVADRSQGVFAGREVDRAGGFEGEILAR